MEEILRVENLRKYFPIKKGMLNKIVGQVKAVDGVSFSLYKGECLGIVGESGSGKSTLGRTILRLLEPTDGAVHYKGTNMQVYRGSGLRQCRRQMQMVFQDPYASLNPRMEVGKCIAEPMTEHSLCSRDESFDKAAELLKKVGLTERHFHRYPFEFSGGQRQRVGIARALSLSPEIIVADEPVSALDVSVQAQILNLFMDLQKELELTYIFIAHDLSVVKHISTRIAVMYLGVIVEIADTDTIFEDARHPYTLGLISAIPVPDPERVVIRIKFQGDIPSPSNPPSGCRLSTRCPECVDICRTTAPELVDIGGGHFVRCHLHGKEGANA